MRLGLPGAWVDLTAPIGYGIEDALLDLSQARPSTPYPIERTMEVTNDTALQLWSGGHSIRSGIQPDDVVDAIVAVLNQWVLDTDPGRLHLHAACVELDGVGIVLAGRSGSGKTTTTVDLLHQGASYLTDESLSILPGSRTVFAYPKPLTIKTGPHTAAVGMALPAAASTGRVALRASTISSIASHTCVGAVVFPTFRRGAPTTVASLSPADAARRLLADSLDGTRLGVGVIDAVACLVGGAACVEIVYGDRDQVADLISALCPPEQSSWVGSYDLRASGEEVLPSLRLASFVDSALLLDSRARMVELHEDEAQALLEATAGGRQPSGRAALDRMRSTGLDLPAALAITTAGPHGFGRIPPCPGGSGGVAGSVTVAHGTARVLRTWDQLVSEGCAPILAGGFLFELDSTVPRGVGGGNAAAMFVVDRGPRDAIGGEGLRVVRSIAPHPYGSCLTHAHLMGEAVPVCVGGRWVDALGPYHRFLHACMAVAFSRLPQADALVAVAMTAPRTHRMAVVFISRARDDGLLALVHKATSVVQREIGGLPPELVRENQHRLARLHRRLAASWLVRQHRGCI